MKTEEKSKDPRVHAGFSQSTSDRIRKEAELRNMIPHRFVTKVVEKFLDKAEAKRAEEVQA